MATRCASAAQGDMGEIYARYGRDIGEIWARYRGEAVRLSRLEGDARLGRVIDQAAQHVDRA